MRNMFIISKGGGYWVDRERVTPIMLYPYYISKNHTIGGEI
jgi:hypothetical protein